MLSEREYTLLKSLIETHIADGHPVGSRTLAKVSGLDVSAATIRNIMADLEDMGLLASPHTSAGRIPTAAGYRLFVDSMLQTKPLTEGLIHRFQSELDSAADSHGLVESASGLLSGVTRLAGIVTLPRNDVATLEQIEFVKLSDRRVLAVLVLGHGEVQNRVLMLDREYSKSELIEAANYLTELFAGMDVLHARQKLVDELQSLRENLNSLMGTAIELGEQVLKREDNESGDYVMAGQTRLMEYEELSDVERLRQLFEIFNTKRDILHVLDRCTNAEGVQIFIGQEAGYDVLENCSVVSAPYTVDGKVVGVLGVIGPTRMAYERVIPIVDVTSRLLSAALNSR
jgi:heat-inducible transcriptional repressor